MIFLLSPAVALMLRLRYPAKFAAVSLVFVLPLALAGAQIVSSLNRRVSFLESERAGIRYLGAVASLLQHAQQHRGLANGLLNGEESFRARLAAKAAELDTDVSKLDALDAELHALLGTQQAWKPIRGEWQSLRGDVLSLTSKTSFERHTAWIAHVLSFVELVSDRSSLTLDPELDSNHLMDAFVRRLPALTESMGQLRAVGVGALSRGKLDERERTFLSVRAELSEVLHAGAVQDLQTSAGADRHTAVAKELGRLRSSGEFLATLRGEVLGASQLQLAPAAYFATATRAIDDAFVLHAATGAQFDALVAARDAAARSLRALTVSGGVVTCMLAAYLLAGFYLSTRRSLDEVSRVISALRDGNLCIEVAIASRDELGEMLAGLREMAASLSRTLTEVREAAEQLSHAADQVRATSSVISDATSSQAISAENTSSAIKQISGVIQETADNARHTDELARRASGEASRAGQAMTDTVQAMQTIAQQIALVHEIAHRTDLLALNAAIEAARAGEQARASPSWQARCASSPRTASTPRARSARWRRARSGSPRPPAPCSARCCRASRRRPASCSASPAPRRNRRAACRRSTWPWASCETPRTRTHR